MPSALPDFVVTNAATPVTINVLANDTGTGLTITSFSNPTNGSLVFNGDKTFTYTPASGFIGDDGFAYTVRDAQGTPANGEVTISVVANTGATVAVDDLVEVIAGNEVVIPVRANDMAADGGALQIIAVSMPGHGAVNVLPDQTIRYVPQSGFTGIDSFNYTVVDGLGSSASATVTVKVLAKSNPPLAIDDTFTIEAGAPTMLAVLANDSDPDGGPLQVVGYTMPAHGQLVFNADKTFVYTPAAGYLGTDQFTYTIRNNRGASAVATVTLAVAEILEIPVAFDDQVTTEAALPVTIDVLANDALPAGQQISIVAVTLPFKGKLAFNPDKTITYTPNPGFVGIDDFTYTIGNGQGGTAKAKVTVDVTPASIAAVYANGYACRRRLAIPAGSARGTSHQNFPLWVELAGSWLKSTANGGKVASADGRDLRFELEGGIRLAHELEHYDAVAGKLGAWVRLPALGAEQPTVVLLYYGKAGLAASEAEPMAVWSDYLAVWHLPSAEDVTSEARLLTPTGTIANSADGLGAGALALDGNGVLMLAETSWLQGLSALSIQLRSKASSIGHDRGQLNVGLFGTDADSDLAIRYQAEGFAASRPTNVIHAKLRTTAGSTGVSSAAGVHTTNWQGLTVAWQSGDSHPDMYLDGRMTEPSFTNRLSGSATTDPRGPLYLGAGPRDTAAGGWVGLIDEVRFSARKLGEAWIATEYANQASPAGFYGYGGEETVTDTEPSIVALPLEITAVAGQHVDIDVLAAAIPAGMDGTVIESVTQAHHGWVSVIDGKIRYTPVAGYAGSDSFTYRLNSAGRSSTSLITATVKSAVSTPQNGGTTGELLLPVRTVNVSSNTQLTAALNDAEPGDHIVLANGTYSSNRTISPNGTATNPIVIRAQFAHQAIVTGVWTVTGDDVTIYQLKFQGAAKVNWSNALRTRFLRNHVDVSTTLWTMSGASHDSEIAYNQWTTSNTSGTDRLVDIRLSSGNVQRAWVHHNYFVNLATDKCFGIGNQRSHTSINTDLLFEYNLAHNCQGTLLYVKCSRIVARFNTRSGTGGGGGYVVNLRHGKNSKVIANVAIQNSYGPVARGDNHEFIGNYYDNARGHSKTFGGGGGAATGDCTEDQFAAGTGARPRAFNCQFIGNIGNLWIGYDSLSNTYPALNNLIRAHSGGTITIDGDALASGGPGGARAQGTIDERNAAPGIEVPQYVILTAADVGPGAA